MKNNPTLSHNGESKIFTFVFSNLAWFLLIINGFLSYSIFSLFSSHVEAHATFVEASNRSMFSANLVFGLMACENLLAMATSFFRQRNEWGKSVIVTIVSGAICYFNHLAIVEVFNQLPANEVSEAVKLKVMLVNVLIWVLGEIVSLLMNSIRQQPIENVPQWFTQFVQSTPNFTSPTAHNGLFDNVGNPITGNSVFAQHKEPAPIGFKMSGSQELEKIRKPRGKSIDHDRVNDLLDKGLSASEIAQILRCTESSIYKIKALRKA